MLAVMSDFWGDYKLNIVIHPGSQSMCDKESRKKKKMYLAFTKEDK